MKILSYTILTLGFGLTFSYGVLVGKYEVFPFQELKAAKHLITNTDAAGARGLVDGLGRLVAFPGKTEVPCPMQTERTGVLLVIGQSNAANHAEKPVYTKFPEANLNYFRGRCYVSGSPLLGSTRQRGEWLTLLGDRLIAQGVYDDIVLISSAIAGSVVARWAEGGDLNQMLISTIHDATNLYNVTDVIWHQGEGDVAMFTHTPTYVSMFESLMFSLSQAGVNAPLFMSIASLCSDRGPPYTDWISNAQQELIDKHDNIVFGVNTDEVVPLEDRYDGCHFGAKAQERVAAELASSIGRYRSTQGRNTEAGGGRGSS